MMSGCKSWFEPNPDKEGKPLTSADGKTLTTLSGAPIVLAEKTYIPTPPSLESISKVGSTSSYKAFAEARRKYLTQTNQITVLEVVTAREIYDVARKEVIARIKAAQGVNDLKAVLEFENGLPQAKADILKQIARKQQKVLDAGAVLALRTLMSEELQTYLDANVYPGIARKVVDGLRPRVEKALSEGKFAFARELIWNASTYEIPGIDDRIRKDATEILHGKVNPQNWDVLEKKIEAAFQKALADKEYDKGVAELKKIEARKDPALKEYYEKLGAFHTTLLWYNCTKENADRITMDLDKDFLALIQLLRKPAKFETTELGALRALQLGTRSLNSRIRTAVADRCRKLEAARDAKIRAAYLAKLKAAKSDLEQKVRQLVAESKFEEARELIWNAAATGDAEWDNDMFSLGLSLLRNLVNPGDWTRIEKDILGTFKKLSEAGKFEELTAFLKNYPLIRQHTVKLDEQLAKVRAEAEALGADPAAAAAAAKTACGMVTEAEKLVDHLDKLEADAAKDGKGIDKTKFQKELDVYAQKLAAYHATDANVKAIVEKLRLELEKLFAQPTNPKTTHLSLGTNAVNDRIRALALKLIASIEKTKYDWQSAQLVRVVTDLEKRVRKAVKEQRFDDARNYIRDEKLIGRKDVDLKLYELRVGLLDSCVNPAQLDFLLDEITKKVADFQKEKDFAGLLEYIANPPQVHDEYEKIDSALAAVKNAMLALEISAAEAEATSVLLGGAYLDQAAVVDYAIKLGAKVDGVSARDPRKRTALMLAIDTQHLTLIQAILKAGASATAADADGNTVMHYAVKSGSVAVVTAIAKTAPMAVVNNAGETPLFAAVRRNQAALVEAVAALVKKADRAGFVNTADKSGLTAFALAAKTGARDVLDPLAAAGAAYSEKDLILAEKGDHVAVAQWLVGKGADVNADGVMAAACPATATGRYLIHEGGVGKHSCQQCQPPKPAEKPAPQKAAKCAQAEGNITFHVKECK